MSKRLIVTVLATVTVAGLSSTNVWGAAGATPGQFAVSPIGSAQYSIPLWVPQGPRGMQPNLSLVYNSQSGIGPMGIGWAVGGLGAVTRCNLTYAQDTTPAPVALTAADGYCLNGNRLRLTSGTYGSAGSTYQTELADFSNVTANGTSGNGPSYFTVQGRNGLTYQYGYTDGNGNGANSLVLATGTSTGVYWLLSKVIDRAGNNYVINYSLQTGTAIPNQILWTPTSEGSSTYAYKMQFNYTSNVPQSSLSKYIGGSSVTNAELLQSVAISYSGTVVRDYVMAYTASPTTGRNELKSVTECTDSTQTTCLLPTTVSYQAGGAGVSTSAITALSSTGTGLTARYDLNGDGYPDLIYNTGTTSYVAFGSATGYGTPVNIGVTAVLVGNVEGSKQDGVLGVSGGTWWFYTWNGSSFSGVSTGLAYDSTAAQYQLADVDGDGLPDLVSFYETYIPATKKTTISVDFRLNTGNGTAATFSSTLTTGYTLGGTAGGQLETPDFQHGKLRRYDFNGDGRDDLALEVFTGGLPSYTVSTYELISTGTAFTATLVASGGGNYAPAFYTNWNDDACTDFVYSGTLYISGCNGTVATTYSVGNVVAAMDWDGDGRTDLIVSNGSTLGVYLSTGGGVNSLLPTSTPYTSTCQYVTMDANADGLDDLGCWSQSGTNPLTYYLHNGANQPPDLATSFSDGFANSATVSYAPITQSASNYSAWNNQAFPNQAFRKPMYVVPGVTLSDPSSATGGTYGMSYYYSGAAVNLQGRGFAGFGAVQTYDSRNGIWRTTDFNQSFPYVGMMSYQVSAQDNLNAKPILTVAPSLTSLTLSNTANQQRTFPYVSAATRNAYEVGGGKNTQLITTTVDSYGTPDSYGNFDSVTKTITDEDSGSPYYGDTWTTTTANTVSPQAGSTWCLNLPTQTVVTNSSSAPNGAAISRTVGFTPDYTNCRETTKITEPSSSLYKVTEAYTFDGFSNLYTDTVTGVGMASRVTSLSWGTTGQFVATVQNPLSQSIGLGYDFSKGVQTSQTDPNYTSSNPLQTTWGYDGFARKIQETRKDGTFTKIAYGDCASTGCLVGSHGLVLAATVYNSDGTIETDGTTYLDSVGRNLVSTKRLVTSGSYDRNEVRYDSLGRVVNQSAPCAWSGISSACSYWTTNKYDILNRLVQSQRPISASNNTLQTTAFGYAGRTSTAVDALINTTTTITLVTGALARTQDAKGYYVNFSYDAFGSLKAASDSSSNVLSSANYAYGLSAFRVASTDMDMGSWSYTFDALGELTAYTDAKVQNFLQTYDALSRPLVRTEPDLTTTWTWGSTASSYNIGKLQSVTAAGANGTYGESYGFDSLTRLQSENISIPSDASYTYTFSYNPTSGLLNTLTYPTSTSGYSLALQYGYSNGILQQVKDANSSTVFWLDTGMNPRGQVTQEALGNGIVTNRAFDAVTGWVANIQSGIGSGAVVQNQSYGFDLDGNVTQRQDNNTGLTENIYYDVDNRLDHSTLNGTLNLQMTYDGGIAGPGNITARSDVAGGSAWTYDSVKKHAVTQAGTGGYAFTYDANGNAITRNGYNVYWSSYNYPISINGLNKNVALYYGPNRNYYEQVYSDESSIETTMYVGGLLEKVTLGSLVDWRHYIRVNNELVAIVSRQSTGTNAVHYALSDQEGSIAQITDASAATTVTENFGAFGSRRNSATWSGTPTCPDLCAMKAITREGYTGHDAMGGVSLGINHMNGRIQDAITGRFLSPDPTIPNAANSQSYNRYTYVLNNPLTLVDPSGFAPKSNCAVMTCNNEFTFFASPPGSANWGNMASGNDGSDDLANYFNSGLTATDGDPGLTFVDSNSTSNNSTTGDAGASGATGSSAPVADAGSAQNAATGGTTAQSACDSCLNEIEVDAPRNLTPNQNFLPPDLVNIPFNCGGFQCQYSMGQFHSGPYRGVWLNFNVFGKTGNGNWVQTFLDSDSGTFHTDWNDTSGTTFPIYPTYASSNGNFFDDPAGLLGSSKTWVAQTSFVLPSGPAFTFMWGYQLSPNGVASYNPPTSVVPWPAQQQIIQLAQ